MKKIVLYSLIILTIICIFLFQIYVIDGRTLFGVKPNMILISVIVISLWYNIYAGSIYGLIVGILTDIMYGNTFGIFTISYVLVGSIIGLLNNNYSKDSKGSLMYLTALGTCIFELSQYIIYSFYSSNSLFYLFIQITISIILNLALAFILYNLLYKLYKHFSNEISYF